MGCWIVDSWGVQDDPVPPLTVGGRHSQVQIFWIFSMTFLGPYDGKQSLYGEILDVFCKKSEHWLPTGVN